MVAADHSSRDPDIEALAQSPGRDNDIFGYCAELNPLHARLAFLNAGLVPPANGNHCELGHGQGLSANIHAAGSGAAWYATDFNPAQAGFARTLAQASGASALLTDEAFADFCARDDLPDFDSIGLHGIWSWINDANRAVIVDFIRRKLKVGGVLYISYNTQPGWAAMAPVRDLLAEHAATMGSAGQGIAHRIDGAIDFADKLFATKPGYTMANPLVLERFQGVKAHNRNYLAHEYFNRDWLPMLFSRMAQWLEPAKLDFACSANYLDHVDAVNLTAEHQLLLQEVPDAMFRQTVRDFMVHQQFRKDYWVKGARKLNPFEQAEGLRAHAVMLVQHRPDVTLQANGALGQASLQEGVYNPLLDALADHQPTTLGELEKRLPGLSFGQLCQAVLVLSGTGALVSVQDAATIAQARSHTERLNTHLIGKARGSADIHYLASPVSGGGVVVNRIQQLFLLALRQGLTQPAQWADLAWQILASQGQRILKDGQTIEAAQDNLAELQQQAQTFAHKQLPILRALLIA